MKNVLGVFCNYAKNDRGKKIITVGIALATINKFCPETANSAETIKQMPNTTLVECLLTSKSPYSVEATPVIQRAKVEALTNSFQDIFIPLPCGLKDDLSSQENLQRNRLYNIDIIPRIIVGGDYDSTLDSGPKWKEKIESGLETQKNWATFELVPKGNEEYTLKIKGTNQELNKYKKVYVNAVLIENVVNVNYPNTMSTIRNVVRDYLFKDSKGRSLPLGKSTVLTNGGTIAEDIKLNIQKGLTEKFTVVAWVQTQDSNLDPKTKDTSILSAATCRLGSGKILDFNWNNWPKNMQDENLMVKPEYYMPLGLGEMNLNLEDAENLKTINFDFNKYDFKEVYRIVGVKPNPELYDITFDQRYNRTVLKFHKPFTGNLENAITFVTDFKKTNVETSTGLRFCWLDMRDKDGNFPYVDMSGEPVQYGPVKLVVSGYKPLDLNQDKKIDYDDVNEVVKAFGCIPTDPEWNQKFDTDKNNRIDIRDLTTIIKAADTENATRAQFHDNLKRLNIWETGIMPVCKIKSARYGYDTRWSDVTELLQEKLHKGNFDLHIMDENLDGNPYPGAFKYLQITYDDTEQKDFNIELEQFSKIRFQKECDSSQSTGKTDAKSYIHKDYLLYYQ